MAIVTGDRYVEKLVKFVESQAGHLIDGTLVLKLNPVGLHYVHSRLESLGELEGLLAGAPVDYLRAYVSDLGDHRALEQLRRILRLLTSLKVVSALPPPPARDPTPLSFLPFGRLKFLELRGCDLSTSAARGLLELRHTLEKLICHNSTDALQHVFASRFADMNKSPQWNRLSFVSCACNDLVLMDESLQLLPAVETLDLSRNKFSKIDNLRRCSKLKHLDLGFNNLRTIASLSEVTCHITKLILRNNALTSLRGLENLKSLEGLDVSYNIIYNFSELEILAGLPLLINLWLEGNPLCCARWFRAQVFSLVSYAERLKIDNQGMTTREFWKWHIIIARRQKRPSSFGFYSLAKDDAECEGIINRRKKKLPRLASIESEDDSVCICSDQGSVSCDNESPNKEENDGNDDEAEVVELMNRVELLKKERSVLWLREVKQWMDQRPDSMNGALSPRHVNISKNKMSCGQCAETSRNMSNSIQASGDDDSTNCLKPHGALSDSSFQIHGQYIDYKNCSQNGGNLKLSKLQLYSQGRISSLPEHVTCSCFDLPAAEKHQMGRNPSGSPLSSVDGIMDSHSSSAYPGSPPHYKEDILHRRNNLVEEILQLSADSFSVVSSDSNTSCSDDDLCEYGSSPINSPLNQEYPSSIVDGRIVDNTVPWRYHDFRRMLEHGKGNVHQLDASLEQTSYIAEHSQPLSSDGSVSYSDVPDNSHFLNQYGGSLRRSRSKRKPIKRVLSLSTENDVARNSGISRKSSVDRGDDPGDELDYQTSNQISTHEVEDAPSYGGICSFKQSDDFIADYFRNMVTESGSPETCRQYLRCDCVLEQDSIYREREVAVLLSSERRLYVLLIGTRFDGSGTIISMLGCHMIQDVKDVTVGMGLQVVRVCVRGGPTYVYITRSIEKSRQLLEILQVVDAYLNESECSVRSLESIQVELFSKLIRGASKSNIYQYSMVLFWHSGKEGKSWLTRSLFVTRCHLIVCVEDIKQFGSLTTGSHSPPYFTLVLCCNIANVSEMVVQEGDDGSVMLELNRSSTQFPPPAVDAGDTTVTWKLKWYNSVKGRDQFVTVLKGLHAQAATQLFVRYMP